jgi:hypothetical protein
VFRLYSVTAGPGGGSAFFAGSANGVYYNMFSVGVNASLKKIAKRFNPVSAAVFYGDIKCVP